MIRLAIIGSGMIGPVHRAAALASGRFDLVAATPSSRPGPAAETGAQWGLPLQAVFHDWREMLAAAPALGLQAVAVTTPNSLHAEQVAAARAAGLFVICDKPLTATLEEAEALEATPGPPVAVTYNYTAFAAVRRIRELVAAGEHGELLQVLVEFAQDGRLSARKPGSWRHDPARAGPAGTLADLGTHAFHLAEFAAGRPVTALVALVARHAGGALDDTAHILLRLGDATGGIWITQAAPGTRPGLRLRAVCARATLDWSLAAPDALGITELGAQAEPAPPASTAEWRQAFTAAFTEAYRAAADLFENRPSPAATLTDGARGLRFIHAAIASDAARAWVDVPPPGNLANPAPTP